MQKSCMTAGGGSVHFATTSLAHSVFQLCGAYGMSPSSALDCGDYLGLVKAEMPRPEQFNTALGFAQAYQAWNLLRKFDSFPIPLDRRAVASSSFDQSEVTCGQINREIGALPWLSGVPLVLQQQSLLDHARSLVHRALGKFHWDELQGFCDFSKGASTRVPRKRGNAVFKLDGRPHVTINCRDLAVHFIWCNELWRKHCQATFGRESDPYSWVQLVPGSRFETVPKDSSKDRPICIEPDLNMFFQKGIGKMIRRRLRRRGIDLDDQTRNQKLALLGSITGELATIDLSAASDSVSLAVVEYLLPEDWFEALMITRSAYVLKDGKYVRLEKISSMGNGYTFELESLIFWALAHAVNIAVNGDPDHLSVYGDDIIVPTQAAPHLIGLLGSLGFETNKNKTFVDGPFRESCGKHYFLGADVTPMKIESPIENWSDLYHFANSLSEWGWATDEEIDSIVSQALKPIPPSRRCYVPMNFGSRTGLRVTEPRRRGRYASRFGCHMYKFRYLRERANEHDLNGPVAYLSSMLLREQRGTPDEGVNYQVLTRTVSKSYSVVTGWTSDWRHAVE